jgi:hypothetical protein
MVTGSRLCIKSKLTYIKKAVVTAFFGLSTFVTPLGLEPRTRTLKVYCSTN